MEKKAVSEPEKKAEANKKSDKVEVQAGGGDDEEKAAAPKKKAGTSKKKAGAPRKGADKTAVAKEE